MKRTLICVVALACVGRYGFAESLPSSHVLVVLDFKGPHSEDSIAEMEHETQEIVKGAGVRLDWRARNEVAQESVSDLVVVQFKGACVLNDDSGGKASVSFTPGPFAFSYEVGGVVQPFGEVACDRVAASVRLAMSEVDFANRDQLLGRALGRVLAHELVHMLTRSDDHGRYGVAKPSLSGKQLIANSLLLDPADVERLKQRPARPEMNPGLIDK